MLSFQRGQPIAIVEGGRYDKKIIHLLDPDKKCCDKCNEMCGRGKKRAYCCRQCPGKGGCLSCNKGENYEPDIKHEDFFDVVDEDFLTGGKKKMTWKELSMIKNAFKRNQEPLDPDMNYIYGSAIKEFKDRSKKEIFINDNGCVNLLPNFEKSERLYVAGPSDSGKSYFISKYIEQWVKVFKKMPIFLFSDVEHDEALDKFSNLRRIILNEDLLENPLKSSDFPIGSLCIFDDIDSIENKKVFENVQKLRDHLLRRGRHEKLYVIVSNHLMTDFRQTRIILNECTSFTIFPKSGASNGIEYLLKKYGGFSAQQVRKVFELNSRAVTIKKTCPLYVVYNKGVYLV